MQIMKHPKSTLQQIADYLSIFWELPVKRRTVIDIIFLSNKEIYTSEDDQGTPRKRHLTCK